MHARLIRCAMTSLVLAVTGGSTVAGCLDRPVVPGEPSTKTNFTKQVAEQAVDKLDILFSIDNSASMGDKQAFLELAIPDLINRLVTPNCVDSTNPNNVDGPSNTSSGTADCTMYIGKDPNSAAEFPAVHDMHIGVVSSSLGPRLGDKYLNGTGGACIASTTTVINGVTLSSHEDDQAHLITRSSDPTLTVIAPPTEVTLPDTQPSGFLAWFPNTAANNGKSAGADPAITTAAQLETDFADLIAGVHEYGCGIESQLENWYRFLIQPDPYATLGIVNGKPAWVGVDSTIIQQRHDFLRPDSLVSIIVLTDENDSEIDVRSLGGQGYYFMSNEFNPPHGTAACATNPADPNCTTLGSKDPAAYSSPTDWGMDLNLRHVHMKAKYGVDPQFPITRYVNGLTSPTVPDRTGEYPTGQNSYVGTNDCTNPLFASTLPDSSKLSSGIATGETATDISTLCKLPASTSRSKSLVFYAIIGGVPWQLLHFDPTSATNSLLSADDWVRILGTDPDTYNYNGIDPHMVESYQPRTGSLGFTTAPPLPALTGAGGTSAAETAPQAPTAASTADPYNGREWITNVGTHVDLQVDREYACIFKLATPRDCSKNAMGAYNVPANGSACDCSSTTLMPDELSPVCDPATPTSQLYAKAYPTIRELNLANKLGPQGIVSSICPIDVTDATGSDPLYGYRPAVATIINRLKNALTNQCLPQTLDVSDAGTGVPCLILATLPPGQSQSVCNGGPTSPYPSFSQPDPSILAEFQSAAEATWLANGGDASASPDPKTLATCQVKQVTGTDLDSTGSCKNSMVPGWCYVTGAAAGTCPQAILFSPGAIPTGATISLQCIETSSAKAAGAGDGG